MTYDERILDLLKELKPITLDEMSSIKLMNRLDTKYVTTKAKLCQLLELVKGKYYVQETNGDLISPYRTTYFDTPDQELELYPTRIEVYAISRDQYLYNKTLNAANNYDGFMQVISEPVQVHTNIEGGIGILGASSKVVINVFE